jgi:Trp operon repressor
MKNREIKSHVGIHTFKIVKGLESDFLETSQSEIDDFMKSMLLFIT